MSALIAALASRHGLPTVNAETLDTFLAPAAGEPEHVLLFFTGDPDQRTDSGDVAVVLPELLSAFPGCFRAGVGRSIGRGGAEDTLSSGGVSVTGRSAPAKLCSTCCHASATGANISNASKRH